MIKYKIPGGVTIIDDDLLPLLEAYNWRMISNGYVGRRENDRLIYLHREILGLTDPRIFTDHINGDPSDNRRQNLRKATPKENVRNAKGKGSSAGYKGVSYQLCLGKYRYIKAAIRVDGKLIRLGSFKTEIDAAKAYNEAARKYHGEFASLNNV